MNILVLDDEKEIADLVEVYLKNENYNVFKFYDSKEAIKCIENQKLDFAILDVMIKDVDGFEICKMIRDKGLNFPVIMLTAKIEDKDKIQGLTLGADDYITKPFNPLELIARVKSAYRRYTKYNEKNEENIEITFKNKGATIPEYKLERIFDKFYRADESRQTNNGGAGLGLAITKEIIELHNGKICAKSNDEFIEFQIELKK